MTHWRSQACGLALGIGLLLVDSGQGIGQQPAEPSVSTAALPDIPSLMHAVETNQHAAETLARHYLYHSVESLSEIDKHGAAKRTETSEYDVYWIGDVGVRRLVRKDGRELTPEEQGKEKERVDKEAAKAHERRQRALAEGKQTDPRGDEEVSVSRLLELGRFTHARRVDLDGRPTIEVDFEGDPQAKTRNRFEEVIRDMQGTAWVDEQDKVLRRVNGQFVRPFKVGGGLLADIRQGTRFQFDQKKINDEVWMPSTMDAVGAVRLLLLFHFDGSARIVNSGYRRFSATSTILPGVGKVEAPADTSDPETQKPKP